MDRKFAEAEFHDRRERDRKVLTESEFLAKYPNKKFYSITSRSREYVEGWLKDHCSGARALDYCCGLGQVSEQLASYGATVVGIDISSDSIDTARKRLADAGMAEKATFEVMDAEKLAFDDDTFDLIVCSGGLHHMDTSQAFPELARVLKPDGNVICIEPLAYNPLIQWYRERTPHLRTDWEKEHILTRGDLKIARKSFRNLSTRYFHLIAIAAAPFHGSSLFSPLLALGNFLDKILLRMPMVQFLAWQMVFVLSGPQKPNAE